MPVKVLKRKAGYDTEGPVKRVAQPGGADVEMDSVNLEVETGAKKQLKIN